jgi:hypothetical protein
MVASVIPTVKAATMAPSIRHGRKAKDGPATTASTKAPAAEVSSKAPAGETVSTNAAAATPAPVTAAPVAPVERAEIRGTVSP